MSNFSTLCDEELCIKAVLDEKAMEELINRYKPMAISLSKKCYLQGGSFEDLISEAMIGLYKAIRSYDEKKSVKFSTFAYICIYRQLMTAIRSSKSNANNILNDYLPLQEQMFERGGVDPEELLLYKEAEIKLTSVLIELLSKFEYEVLNNYIEGMSYLEIADKLQCEPKKVDNALNRAKNKVSKAFRK